VTERMSNGGGNSKSLAISNKTYFPGRVFERKTAPMSCDSRACSFSAAPALDDTSARGKREAEHGAGGDATEAVAGPTSYRAVLGRAAWLLMHEMSQNLPCAADLPRFYSTIRSIVNLYPCVVCRDNAVRLLQTPEFADPQPLPVDDEAARQAARAYVNKFHAAVTMSIAARGGYVSARSAELARAYFPSSMKHL